MGLFDRFIKKKKEEPHYDSTDIRVQDLDLGFVFDYDLETWEVKEMYEYDWGDEYFTYEYKIFNGKDTLFLGLEDDDELELAICKKIKLRKLGESVVDDFFKGKAPKKINYEGKDYFLEEESPGYFHDVKNSEDAWEEFISWDYEDDEGENFITVEQWEEKEFEASTGKYINEYEISNLLPASTD